MSKIEEAQEILNALGLPTAQQNEMAALTLLVLCHISEEETWKETTRRSLTLTKGIMQSVAKTFGRVYAPNTRETFRRQVLHQFIQAGIVDYNPDNPSLPTNSPHAHYALSEEAEKVIRSYGSRTWRKNLEKFLHSQELQNQQYRKERSRPMIPARLPDGTTITFSPGKHNELQRLILEEFTPRFAPSSQLLYVGDTDHKQLVVDKNALVELGINLTGDGKLPDIILYDEEKRWLFLIEAVTSHGPMTPKRVRELSQVLRNAEGGCIFVTAFVSFADFHRHGKEIAWETEIWIAEHPNHLIHYNGDRFLGPRI